jgi:hypothetical protein
MIASPREPDFPGGFPNSFLSFALKIILSVVFRVSAFENNSLIVSSALR